VDAAAPFFPVPPPADALMVVSAANAPFFDRLENMVASVQVCWFRGAFFDQMGIENVVLIVQVRRFWGACPTAQAQLMMSGSVCHSS